MAMGASMRFGRRCPHRHGIRLPGPNRATRHRLGGRARPAPTIPTSPRAKGRPASAIYPARRLATASASTSKRTQSRLPVATRSPVRRVRKTMDRRIAPGVPLIHNLERARNALVIDSGLENEAHRADMNDPV